MSCQRAACLTARLIFVLSVCTHHPKTLFTDAQGEQNSRIIFITPARVKLVFLNLSQTY